jgi:hypothetical protein
VRGGGGVIERFLYFSSNNIYETLILRAWKTKNRTDDDDRQKKSHPIYVFGDIKRSLCFKGGVVQSVA